MELKGTKTEKNLWEAFGFPYLRHFLWVRLFPLSMLFLP